MMISIERSIYVYRGIDMLLLDSLHSHRQKNTNINTKSHLDNCLTDWIVNLNREKKHYWFCLIKNAELALKCKLKLIIQFKDVNLNYIVNISYPIRSIANYALVLKNNAKKQDIAIIKNASLSMVNTYSNK